MGACVFDAERGIGGRLAGNGVFFLGVCAKLLDLQG
jgi:hypothetical protein